MTFFGLITRLILNYALSPEGQNALSTVGRYAVRQGTRAFIRAVSRGNSKMESEKVK